MDGENTIIVDDDTMKLVLTNIVHDQLHDFHPSGSGSSRLLSMAKKINDITGAIVTTSTLAGGGQTGGDDSDHYPDLDWEKVAEWDKIYDGDKVDICSAIFLTKDGCPTNFFKLFMMLQWDLDDTLFSLELDKPSVCEKAQKSSIDLNFINKWITEQLELESDEHVGGIKNQLATIEITNMVGVILNFRKIFQFHAVNIMGGWKEEDFVENEGDHWSYKYLCKSFETYQSLCLESTDEFTDIKLERVKLFTKFNDLFYKCFITLYYAKGGNHVKNAFLLLNNKELENICFFGFIYITYKNGKVADFIEKVLLETDIFERNAVGISSREPQSETKAWEVPLPIDPVNDTFFDTDEGEEKEAWEVPLPIDPVNDTFFDTDEDEELFFDPEAIQDDSQRKGWYQRTPHEATTTHGVHRGRGYGGGEIVKRWFGKDAMLGETHGGGEALTSDGKKWAKIYQEKFKELMQNKDNQHLGEKKLKKIAARKILNLASHGESPPVKCKQQQQLEIQIQRQQRQMMLQMQAAKEQYHDMRLNQPISVSSGGARPVRKATDLIGTPAAAGIDEMIDIIEVDIETFKNYQVIIKKSVELLKVPNFNIDGVRNLCIDGLEELRKFWNTSLMKRTSDDIFGVYFDELPDQQPQIGLSRFNSISRVQFLKRLDNKEKNDGAFVKRLQSCPLSLLLDIDGSREWKSWKRHVNPNNLPQQRNDQWEQIRLQINGGPRAIGRREPQQNQIIKTYFDNYGQDIAAALAKHFDPYNIGADGTFNKIKNRLEELKYLKKKIKGEEKIQATKASNAAKKALQGVRYTKPSKDYTSRLIQLVARQGLAYIHGPVSQDDGDPVDDGATVVKSWYNNQEIFGTINFIYDRNVDVDTRPRIIKSFLGLDMFCVASVGWPIKKNSQAAGVDKKMWKIENTWKSGKLDKRLSDGAISILSKVSNAMPNLAKTFYAGFATRQDSKKKWTDLWGVGGDATNCRVEKTKRFIINNASNPDLTYFIDKKGSTQKIREGQKQNVICTASSIIDAQPACSWGISQRQNQQYLRPMRFNIRNENGNAFYFGGCRIIGQAALGNVQYYGTCFFQNQKHFSLGNISINGSTGKELQAKVVYSNLLDKILEKTGQDFGTLANFLKIFSNTDGHNTTFDLVFKALFPKSMGDYFQEVNSTFNNGAYVSNDNMYDGTNGTRIEYDNDGNAVRIGISNDTPSGFRQMLWNLLSNFNMLQKPGVPPSIGLVPYKMNTRNISGYLSTADSADGQVRLLARAVP